MAMQFTKIKKGRYILYIHFSDILFIHFWHTVWYVYGFIK